MVGDKKLSIILKRCAFHPLQVIQSYRHLHTRSSMLITGRFDCQDRYRAMICPRSPPHRLSVRRNRRNAPRSPGSDKSCMFKKRDMACARRNLMIGHWEFSSSHSLDSVNNAPRFLEWVHPRSHPRFQSQKRHKVWILSRSTMKTNYVLPRWVSVHADQMKHDVWRKQGHKQELKRHFSVWSLIGLAANCTISWTGMFNSAIHEGIGQVF